MQTDVHHFSAADIEPIQRLLARLGRPSLRSVATAVVIATALALLACVAGEPNLAAFPGIALAIAGVAWLTHGSSRGTLERWVTLHVPCAPVVAWGEVGFRSAGCVHGTDSAFPWNTVRAAIASPDYIILQSRGGPLIIPQRALDAERASDLLRRLEANNIAVRLAD